MGGSRARGSHPSGAITAEDIGAWVTSSGRSSSRGATVSRWLRPGSLSFPAPILMGMRPGGKPAKPLVRKNLGGMADARKFTEPLRGLSRRFGEEKVDKDENGPAAFSRDSQAWGEVGRGLGPTLVKARPSKIRAVNSAIKKVVPTRTNNRTESWQGSRASFFQNWPLTLAFQAE